MSTAYVRAVFGEDRARLFGVARSLMEELACSWTIDTGPAYMVLEAEDQGYVRCASAAAAHELVDAARLQGILCVPWRRNASGKGCPARIPRPPDEPNISALRRRTQRTA